MKVLRAADRVPVVWRNGGGLTREVAARPAHAGLDQFDWRISLAEVAVDGAFSAFPGVDRLITVVEGGGMELTVDGTVHPVLERHRPFAFPGDAETGCRLPAGPVTALNVMCGEPTTRGGRFAAAVETVRTDRPLPVKAGRTVLLLVLDGSARLGSILLGRHDAVLLDGTAGVEGASVDFGDAAGVAVLVTLDWITGL